MRRTRPSPPRFAATAQIRLDPTPRWCYDGGTGGRLPRFVAALATQQWPSKPHPDLEVARLLAACRARVSKERGGVFRLDEGGLVLIETVSPSGKFRPVQLSLPIRPRLVVLGCEEEP